MEVDKEDQEKMESSDSEFFSDEDQKESEEEIICLMKSKNKP